MSRKIIEIPDVKIDPEVIEQFEAMSNCSNRGFEWTPERKKLLLTYWPIKNHDEVAEALGVSSVTALKWYREFTKDDAGN